VRATAVILCFLAAALLGGVPDVSHSDESKTTDSDTTGPDSTSAHQDTFTVTKGDTVRGVAVVDIPDSILAQFDTTRVEEAHPQDSPENKGFLIITSDGRASLRIRGSIRLSGALDLGGLQTAYSFDTYRIPTGGATDLDPRFILSAAQSRIGLDAARATRYGEAFMRFEMDFLGEVGNPNELLRLRHAYGSLAGLLAGQTWTLLSDITALPVTVDLDGPNSAVTVRTPQIRLSREGQLGARLNLSIESPSPDVLVPDSLEQAFQSFPDFGARAGYFSDSGHARFAGMLRSITVRDVSGQLSYLVGLVGLLGAHKDFGERNKLLLQAVAGPAAARFITALQGHGLDALYNPATDEWELVVSGGGYVSFKHGWREGLYSYLTVGGVYVKNKPYQPPDAFANSHYISGNIFWDSLEGTRMGAEASWGRREDKNGADGSAARISFITYYDF